MSRCPEFLNFCSGTGMCYTIHATELVCNPLLYCFHNVYGYNSNGNIVTYVVIRYNILFNTYCQIELTSHRALLWSLYCLLYSKTIQLNQTQIYAYFQRRLCYFDLHNRSC